VQTGETRTEDRNQPGQEEATSQGGRERQRKNDSISGIKNKSAKGRLTSTLCFKENSNV